MPPSGSRSNYRSNSEVAVYDDEFRGYRLFIGNIAPGVTEHDVCKYFGNFGEVKMVWLARDPPGFAYVVYFDRDVAEMARNKTHMCRWFNRLIKVEYAVPRGRNPRRANFSSADRRSRSQDNSHRFRSRGVRINRSRSPINGGPSRGRRYSDSHHSDVRNNSRGMFPPPPPRSNYNSNDQRSARRDRYADNDSRRYENTRPSARDFTRYNGNDGRANSRRNDDGIGDRIEGSKSSTSRSRYNDNDNENLKRVRRQTSGDDMHRGGSVVEGSDKRRRNNGVRDADGNGNHNLPPSRSLNGSGSGEKKGDEKAVDRSPGEVDDGDEIDDRSRNDDSRRRKRRNGTLSPARGNNGVSRTTTRYRSPPDADNGNEGAGVTRKQRGDDYAGRVYTVEQNGSPAERDLLPSPETGHRYHSRSNSADGNGDNAVGEQQSHSRYHVQDQNADYEELDEDDDAGNRPSSRYSGDDRKRVNSNRSGSKRYGHNGMNSESPGTKQYTGKEPVKQGSNSPSPGAMDERDSRDRARSYRTAVTSSDGGGRGSRRHGE